MRTLLVGIDGACFGVLEDLFDRGAVPTIRSLFEDGAGGPLRSRIPPWTPSAWPTLYTGTNPGKHGVFGFLSFDGYDWDVVNSTDVREPAIWELLDYHGCTSVVVNVPVTHPPQAFDGVLVPGYLAPESPACHPQGTLAELRDHVGEYRVYPVHTGQRDAPREEMIEEYRAVTRMRGEAFRYLAARTDPDFGFVQFQQTDTVIHECPDDRDAIRCVYEAVDEQLASILDSCDPAAVILASDHGVGEYEGYEFRVNDFLRDEGFVETTRGGSGMPTWGTVRDEEFRQPHPPSRTHRLLAHAAVAAARLGLTSQRLESVLRRAGLAEFVLRHVPQSVVRSGTEHVDFSASRAYMRHRCELGVRLNLEGRDPNGVVPAQEYESVRDELVQRLRAVRTPDGEPIFEAVGPREEYFHGPRIEAAVDIVTVPAAFDQFLSSTLRGGVFGEPTQPWNHKLHGVVTAAGTGIDEETTVVEGRIDDIAPTVLATFGFPRGDRMDGRSLPFVDSAGRKSYPEYEPERTSPDENDVASRLSALGYLR